MCRQLKHQRSFHASLREEQHNLCVVEGLLLRYQLQQVHPYGSLGNQLIVKILQGRAHSKGEGPALQTEGEVG